MTEKYIRLDDVMTIIARKHLFKDKTDFDKCVHAIAEQIKALDTIEVEPQGDLISRKEALMALTGFNLPTDKYKLIALYDKRIKALPTVEAVPLSVIEDIKAFIAKDIIFYDLTERDKLNEFIDRKIKEIEHE